ARAPLRRAVRPTLRPRRPPPERAHRDRAGRGGHRRRRTLTMRVIERDSAGASPAPEIFWVVSRWAHAVVRALEAKGVDGRALAVRAGLDMRALDDPDGRLPITGTGRLWRLAVDATGDPAFGLFASRYLTFPTFQALGVALMASTSVKD